MRTLYKDKDKDEYPVLPNTCADVWSRGTWQLVNVPFRRAGKVSSHLLATTGNFAAVVTFQEEGKGQ